jgi:AcrR family transcriptional regulator
MKKSARTSRTGHRTRVGRERRARTQRRIVEAALQVFAEKGIDAPVIDDFIRAAGVARGTFYNYFTSTQELLTATTRSLEDALIQRILAGLRSVDDPVLRLALGVRMWLRWAQQERAWCAFVVRSRFRGELVERQLLSDLRSGRRRGAFAFPSPDVARDLVVGTVLEAMSRLMTARVPRSYNDDVTRTILHGLGLGRAAIARLLRVELPELADGPQMVREPSSRR